MHKYFKEFREFAVKDNAVDLAVAVIIGSAFGKIISSLVVDIIMPIASALLGGFNLADLKIIVRAAELAGDGMIVQPAIIFKIGVFLQNIVDFVIISVAIFLILKFVSRLKRKLGLLVKMPEGGAVANTLTKDQETLIEIRDILQKQTIKNDRM